MKVDSGVKINELSSEFREFYSDYFIPFGYREEDLFTADGVYSSQWGYKNQYSGDYLVFSYTADQVVHKNEVGGGPCPCTLQFTVTAVAKFPPVALTSMQTENPKIEGDATMQQAYLIDAYIKDGRDFVLVDYVQVLSGKESLKAQVEDGLCKTTSPDDCYDFPGGYTRNQNPTVRLFEVPPSTHIFLFGSLMSKKFELDHLDMNRGGEGSYYYSGTEEEYNEYMGDSKNHIVLFDEFLKILSNSNSSYETKPGFKTPKALVMIDARNNIISYMVEPYRE